VSRVLDDPALARSLGEAGALRARDFAWDTVTDRVVDVYTQARLAVTQS
jgi:hypothetical protein